MSSCTIKDVAKAAGVSTATVSRTLNNDPKVKKATRERVMKAVQELDFILNNAARSLRTKRSYTIGLICPKLTNIFFMKIAEGIEAFLRENGYHLIISNSFQNIRAEEQAIQIMQEKSVDGLIIIPSSDDHSIPESVQNLTIPTILVERSWKNAKVPAVLTEDAEGTCDACRILINTNPRTRILPFIGGPDTISTARERYEGYVQAMNKEDLIVRDNLVFKSGFDESSGYSAMKTLLETMERPFRVFTANLSTHIGATECLMERKINPSDVMIGAFDFTPMYPLLNYCKVFVSQPLEEMGKITGERILQIIRHKSTDPGKTPEGITSADLESDIRLPTKVVEIG